MAEYNDIIKQFKRMCWYYSRDKMQKTCPMCASYPNCNIGQCRKIAFEKPAHFAATVMCWAEEHPEPVYPTWLEWMKEQELCKDEFAYDDNAPFDHQLNMASTYIRNHILFDGERVALVTQKAYRPIPADIAEKLGLQPKEEKV